MEINHHLILVCSPPSLVKFSCTEMDLIWKKHHNWLLRKSVRIFTSLWYLYNAGDEKKKNQHKKGMIPHTGNGDYVMWLIFLLTFISAGGPDWNPQELSGVQGYEQQKSICYESGCPMFCLSCRIYFLSDLFSILTYTSNCNWRIPAQKFTYA